MDERLEAGDRDMAAYLDEELGSGETHPKAVVCSRARASEER